MSFFTPYIQLARLDKPAGFMLLVLPTWWAQVLATPDGTFPDPVLFGLFFIGAVVMRAAGCAINDVLDHKLDAQVERTRLRPIASGVIKPWQGVVFAIICALIGLLIVLQMNVLCFWLALASLPLIAAYPLMKRITWWPQAFLGLVFNWGALMGFAAVQGTLPTASFILYAACFFWTLAYDTIYAFQDVADDALAGIKSTARRLGKNAKQVISIWFAVSFALLIWVGITCGLNNVFIALMLIPLIYMAWQLRIWREGSSTSSRAAFGASTIYGVMICIAFLLGKISS